MISAANKFIFYPIAIGLCGLVCLLSVNVCASEPDYQNSFTVAQELVNEFPEHPQSYILLGKVQQAQSQWDDAAASYKKSFELNPQNTEAAILCAQTYEKKYEYETAIEWYQKSINDRNPQYGLHEKIGLNYMQLNQTDGAIQSFQTELEHHPNNASTHYYLAQQLVEAKELDKAKHHAEQCIKLDDRYPEPVYLLAQIARQQNEMQQAQDYLTLFREKKKKESEYVEENPVDTSSSNTLASQVNAFAGAVYFQQGNDRKAEEYLRQAIVLDPKQIEARVNLLQIYTTTKNIAKLENTLRELHTLKPDDVSYMVQLGDVLNAKKQWDEALTLLEKAHSLSANTQTKKSLAHALMTSMKNSARALQLMLEVVQEEPNAANYDFLSRAYYVNRNLPLCIEAMQMASQLAPNNRIYQQRLQKLQTLHQ